MCLANVCFSILCTSFGSSQLQEAMIGCKPKIMPWSYLNSRLGALLFKIRKLHDLSHDEAFLEVRVDLPSRLWCLGAFLQVRIEKSSKYSIM